MGSFGKSFDEAFKPANAQSIAGSYDVIKQKIVDEQKKATDKSQASTINHAALAAALNTKDPDLIKNAVTMVDAIGDSTPEASKLLFSTIQDRIKAQTTLQNQKDSYAMRSQGLQLTQPSQMNDWNKQQAEANTVNEMKAINPESTLTANPPAMIGGQQYSPIPGVKTPTQQKSDSLRSDAKDIADGIKNGTQPPVLTGLGRTGLAGEVRAQLARQGVDYSKLVTDWTSTQAFAKNLNSTEQIRLNQALNSVQQSIEPLKKLSQEVERVKFVPANRFIINSKINGIGLDTKGLSDEQVKVATKYVTQINLMRDELAQGFMAGGVPTDGAFKMTDNILNPAYGKGQLGAALDQVQTNLNIRHNAINTSNPTLIGGGNNNGMVTIYNSKGESKQVTAEEAKKLGVKGV